MLGIDNTDCILMIVQQIPEGKVATYGQIARLAGIPRNARQVGTVLRKMPSGSGIPWYRVVNSRGEISERENPTSVMSQREALESEGVEFDAQDKISLAKFKWKN